MKDTSAIHKAAQALGRLGGKAGTGKAKARDPKKMSKAGKKGARARWGDVKMVHRGCGGNIIEDNSVEPYHYNSTTGTSNPEDPVIPAYRCARCKQEILGDAQIK